MKQRSALVLLLALSGAGAASAQETTYRGFGEFRTVVYPQPAPNDPDQVELEGRVRFEAAHKPVQWLTLAASLEARADNLEQADREWRVDVRDRTSQRPAVSLRQAVATARRNGVSLDAGKQFIRWGKTDILTPTDRFAPRDFLEVTDSEFLAVTGLRTQYQRGAHAIDLVWVPVFTPSRTPLLNRRWTAVPETAAPVLLVDAGARFPKGSQAGARWNVVGAGYEFSLSYFDGFNHLPSIATYPVPSQPVVAVERYYPPLRMAGSDGAVSLRWFTIKGEAAYMTTTSGAIDDVVLYVVQLERQSGELSLVGGYAGEIVTTQRVSSEYSPDRGLTRALLGRADYTIDANRSVSGEVAVRRNLDGMWLKGEYSQARGAHWRGTVSGTLIRGQQTDFFGQYRSNSHLLATLRYSF